MSAGPLDHGRTIYRVVVEFSDGYASHDHPRRWNWASLIDQPDARVLSVNTRRNPNYREDNA